MLICGNFEEMLIYARNIICCLMLLGLLSQQMHAQECKLASVPFIFDEDVIDSLNSVTFSNGVDCVLMMTENKNDSMTYYLFYVEKSNLTAFRIDAQGIYRGQCFDCMLPTIEMFASLAVCEEEAQLKLVAPISICPTLVLYQPEQEAMVMQYDNGCSSFDLNAEKRVLREALYKKAHAIIGDIASWTFESDYTLQY